MKASELRAKNGDDLQKELNELLKAQFPDHPVRFGMIVGNPPLRKTIEEMIAAGV